MTFCEQQSRFESYRSTWPDTGFETEQDYYKISIAFNLSLLQAASHKKVQNYMPFLTPF